MKLNLHLDTDQFFNAGFVVNQIDLATSDMLLNCLKNSVFKTHSGFYSKNEPPDVVSWSYQEEETPDLVSDFWQNVSSSSLFDIFTTNYGDFSFLKMSAHRYVQNQRLLWHHDFHEALPVNNILYLSESDVSENDGGFLEIGRWNSDRNGWGKQDQVVKTATIAPKHGTLVSLFNMNPSIVHSVTPLKNQYGRYSLICRMGYKENVTKSKITSLM